MFNPTRSLSIFILVFFVVCFVVNTNVDGTCSTTAENPVADVMIGSSGVNFMPKVSYKQLLISVARADGTVFQQTFESGSMPYIDLSSIFEGESFDGTYTYELKVIPTAVNNSRQSVENAGLNKDKAFVSETLVQIGSFLVQNGSIVVPTNAPEGLSKTADVLHYDDVIITGSLCVGFDCINGESFGYCTEKLKENNLQLCFEDTSTSTFPTNDWKIQINDTTSGGASYFTIWDTDAGRRPFTIEAGAPAHSLYVEDYGRVGLGTSIPYVELHIVDGDSPTIRLDQDGTSGWAAQRWDLCGNETNFFVRDVTNGSKLCFRIQPNTPSNTLCLKSTGYAGFGTWSPEYPIELETTGVNAEIAAQRTDGATCYMSGGLSRGFFGTKTNHPLRISVNDTYQMEITANSDINMADGGSYNGTWNPASSRELKENIEDLTTDRAMDALSGLTPVTFNYKKDKEDPRVGFIAEDVPDLVAMKDRKSLGTVDILAVLTKVVQEQQKTINELKQKVAELEKK